MLVFHEKVAAGNNKKSFEKVLNFKYLGKTLKQQHSMHEEIRSRLHPGNS